MPASLNPVPKIVSALAARTQLGQIMRRARSENVRFVVDRRGEPQVVIMGIKDFLKTIAPEKTVLAAIRASSRKKAGISFPCAKSTARFAPTAESARSNFNADDSRSAGYERGRVGAFEF